MDNNDLLDYYIVNNSVAAIQGHIEKVQLWEKEKILKAQDNPKKAKRIIARINENSYKAFNFIGYRIRTRYRQSNYERFSYKVEIISNDFYKDIGFVTERIKFLKEHDFNVTYNDFEREDQRKALTKELKEIIKIRDNYTCQMCGKFMPDEVGLHIDHIISIKDGGKSIPSNLRVLCSKCNGKKGSRSESNSIEENIHTKSYCDDEEYLYQNETVVKAFECIQLQFNNAYLNLDFPIIQDIVNKVININLTNSYDCSKFHFFLLETTEQVYSLRDKFLNAETLSINLCKKDIELFDLIAENLKGCRIGTLSRLAIIYEKNGMIDEAVKLCDIGIKFGFADNNGKNFIFRKERLEKKL